MNAKSKLKVIGLVLIAIGIGSIGLYSLFEKPGEPEQVDLTEEKTSRELHNEIERAEKPPEVTVQKTYTNPYNNFTIDYEVGIENGVEETPPPDVLVAISESFSEEEKAQWLEDYYNSEFYKQRHQYDEQRARHNVYLIKQYIDEAFNCTSYKELAYKYKADYMFDDNGDWVDAEGYIYDRAFNECIDPKYQEELEEVKEKLKEVNEPN